MSYPTSPMTTYLDDLASNKPAPGGGSAAALAGALGSALGSMVTNFTVGKEKFATVEKQAQVALAECERLRVSMTNLIQADVDAYGRYTEASKLPKATDEEKAHRQQMIQQSLEAAANVPMQVCRESVEILRVSETLLDIGNPNLISDVGCAAELTFAALRCGVLNVEVNHGFIKNEVYVKAQKDELPRLLNEAEMLRERIWVRTREAINK